jgi:hypothetical protein
MSHHVGRQTMWQGFRSADRLARRKVLGLPVAPLWGPYSSDSLLRSPILHGFSPSVIPKPPDWHDDVHVTGYWFLDPAPDWTPPPALLAFLEVDPPPIYVGFGSRA